MDIVVFFHRPRNGGVPFGLLLNQETRYPQKRRTHFFEAAAEAGTHVRLARKHFTCARWRNDA